VRRMIRERTGLSQGDIALPLGVSRAAISHWERGEREPRGARLDAYLALLERLQQEIFIVDHSGRTT